MRLFSPSTWFGNSQESPIEKVTEEVNVTEAVGQTVDVDDDDSQWRRISGDNDRNLSPFKQERMRDIAYKLWEMNLLANRLIELPLAYLLAEGVKITNPEEEHQQTITRFLNDPINKFDVKLEKKMREMSLFGNQYWPAFVNEHSGHVRLGYLDPGQVEKVIFDPDNPEQPIGVITKRDKKGNFLRYQVIINGPEEVFTERTQGIREQFEDGELFYFNINALSLRGVGKSDLLAQADFLDLYDNFLFGEAERSDFLRAFVWDVTVKGADKEQIDAKAKSIKAPAPGSVRVHNENEEWKAVSPTLNSGDTDQLARLLRNHSLGGATMPEHWFGGGGDVNRATGDSMSEPTEKMFTMRQNNWKVFLKEMAIFCLRMRAIKRDNKSDPEFDDVIYQTEVVFPELSAKDTTKYAAALQQVTVAAQLAINAGLITKETGLQWILSISGRLGVEFDAKEELKLAEKKIADTDEKDLFKEGKNKAKVNETSHVDN
jgi:Phage portal protein, SPP1 Gp6-like